MNPPDGPDQPAPTDAAAPPDVARCPYPHAASAAPPELDAAARARIAERAHHWRGDPARAQEMATNAALLRAGSRGETEVGEQFVRTLGKKLGYGHPLSERGEELTFTWTPEAEARLMQVPDFCRELTRWRVEWTAHKLGLGDAITPEVMEAKYDMWGQVSHAIGERRRDPLPWSETASARLDRVPEFVRGQVVEAIEGNARAMGRDEVDDSVVDAVIDRWRATGDFHEGRYGFR